MSGRAGKLGSILPEYGFQEGHRQGEAAVGPTAVYLRKSLTAIMFPIERSFWAVFEQITFIEGGRMPLRMRVHDKEPIGMALRRFKKLVERSGMQKELRARQHYEKPCEQRRRAQLRKQKSARRAQELT
jgi:small subunit ribosomal protein S21